MYGVFLYVIFIIILKEVLNSVGHITKMTDGISKEVGDLFNKKFYFNAKKISLPNLTKLFKSERWEIEKLLKMKDELNYVKSKLDDKQTKIWKNHTNYTNKAGKIKFEVRNSIKPEQLTQAWLKFIEIVSTYSIILNDIREYFYTFHLCEAPGAFIAALNHVLVMKNVNCEWKWMANTLNPYYEGNCSSSTIMDDTFIINTLENWYFGEEKKSFNTLFFLNDINEDFLKQLIRCTKEFKTYQEETIEENLRYNKDMTKHEVKHLNLIKDLCSEMYISKYCLAPISTSSFIVSKNDKLLAKNFNRTNIQMWEFDDNLKKGSLNSRREEEKKGWNLRVKIIKNWLSSLQTQCTSTSFSIMKKPFEDCQKSWIKFGQEYRCITNSKFCIPCILNVWNEIINNRKNLDYTLKEYRNDWKWSYVKREKFYLELTNFEILINMNVKNIFPEVDEVRRNILKPDIKVMPFNESKYKNKRKILFASYSVTDLVYDINEYQINVLEDCIKILRIINGGDSLFLCIQGALTRFSAGIIFLLCCLFHQVLVLNPVKGSSPLSNQIWIFSSCNIEYIDDIKSHLECVLEILNKQNLNKVLEIVPIRMLCEKSFYTYLLENNEEFITQKLHSLLNC